MSSNNYLTHLNLPEFNHKIERGLKESCQLCRAEFGVFTKEHICKRCLRSVCFDCAPHKVKTYLGNRNIRLHRNCNRCYEESITIRKYIEDNKVKWGQDSDLLFLWSKSLIDRKYIRLNRGKSSMKNYVNLDNLWMSFNFSFRDFVSIVIEDSGVQDSDLMRIINQGMEEIKYGFENRVEEGLYLYLFFLCHSKFETAFNLTLFVLETIEKSNINKQNLQVFMTSIGFSQIEAFKVNEFIKDNEDILKNSASVNVMPINVSLEIMNLVIINKSLQFLWRGILFSFLIRKEEIIKKLEKPTAVLIDLLRNASTLSIKNGIKSNSSLPTIDQENDKYARLLKDYEILKEKSEILEREVADLRKERDDRARHKAVGQITEANYHQLTEKYSNMWDEFNRLSLRTSAQDSNQIEFQTLLQQKNEDIVKLKNRNEEALSLLLSKCNQKSKIQQELQQTKKDLEEKSERLTKTQAQNIDLKNKNSLLLKKLEELSKLLMDQEESAIHNHNLLNQLKGQYKEVGGTKEECSIY